MNLIGGFDVTILEMIEVWRAGCSCAEEGKPEQCEECTLALIIAIENKIISEEAINQSPAFLK